VNQPTRAGSRPAFTPGQSYANQVPNYLVQAILVTIFCCLPFGIVSIVFAAQVNGKVAAGDVAGAREVSNKARTWAWVSFWLGLVAGGGWLVLGVIGGLASGF
jgi:hypothetical protein